MSAHREEHLDLCAGYALGNLEAAGQAELEAHLDEGCAECKAAIAELASAAALVAASAPPAALPPNLLARVMNVVHASPQHAGAEKLDGVVPAEVTPRDVAPDTTVRDVTREPRPAIAASEPRARIADARPDLGERRRGWGLPEWALATAAVLLAIATLMSWRTAQQLRATLDDRQRQNASLTQQLAEERRWAEVSAAPGAQTVSFANTPQGAGNLRARATWDPARRRAVLVFDGFTPPAGRDYQLWAMKGESVESLGVIRADAAGHAVMRLAIAAEPAELTGFAVSLEPAGGAPTPAAPTGPVVMAAKLGG